MTKGGVIRIRYIAKKRLQKLKEQGIVNNGASNVRDEGMLQDFKDENALECSFEPTVDGDSVTSHHSHETSDDSSFLNAEDEMEYEGMENLNLQDKSPGASCGRNQQDLYVKFGSDEWMECWANDPFCHYYGNYNPNYFRNRRTHPTIEETTEYWPVTSVEWMYRYIDDPNFDTYHEMETPMYRKRQTDCIHIYAPEFVIEAKRRAMLWQKMMSKIPEALHSDVVTAVKDYIERWSEHQKENALKLKL